MQQPMMTPEQIALRAGQQVPYLHLPERHDFFAGREARLKQLAPAHVLRDFLGFAAALARSQHEALLGGLQGSLQGPLPGTLQDALERFPAVPLPDAAALKAAAALGKPPLPAAGWPRDPAWRTRLRAMLDELAGRLPAGQARAAVHQTLRLDDAQLEGQADRLLAGESAGLEMAAAPLIAAGLQVYWAHMVFALQDAAPAEQETPFARAGEATRCPCCGSLPMASMSRIDPGGGHYRYLQCALCPAQWHMVRIKCSRCESTKGIHYQTLQAVDAGGAPGKAAVEAETCDECGHYLKIFRMERDPQVEAMADDLASLTLDLLLSQAGYRRHGLNLWLRFPETANAPVGSSPPSG